MGNDSITQFCDAMRQRSMIPPQPVVADGKIHRCDVEGNGGKNDGAYVLHPDGVPAGGFINYKDGAGWQKWRADRGRKFTPEEKAVYKLKMQAMQREREAETAKRYEEGQKKAAAILKMAVPTMGDHPYEVRKQITAGGRIKRGAWKQRHQEDCLLVPLYDSNGIIWNVQAIFPQKDAVLERDKDFLFGARKAGLYCPIGTLDNAAIIIVCEGYATAMSCHMAIDLPVVAALDAGNIAPVMEELRKKYPAARVIICGDDDVYKPEMGNTGRTKATSAAQKYGCTLVFPIFCDTSTKPTDFNDLHCLEGLEVIKAQLLEAIANQPDTSANVQATKTDLNAEVKRLSALPPLEYEQVREAEAKRLKLRVGALDKAVESDRRTSQPKDSCEFIMFPEITAWPDPVDGNALLTDIVVTIQRFIVCDKDTAVAVALWCVFTWVIEYVHVAPIALITAPEKRCGKTQLLNLMGKLVRKPLVASNISPSATFRVIEAYSPTLLIDEADSFFKENEELRGVINSGHTRQSAYVIRNVSDDHEPKQFSTWGAKAISGIGKLSDTIMDRSIILTLRRKLPNEKVERLRHAEDGLFETLAAKIARLTGDMGKTIAHSRPALPEALNDRAQDNWEPLLAIADYVGGEWSKIARKAALKLSGAEHDTLSLSTELLADIKEVFEKNGKDRISTADLITALCADDEKVWATYTRGNHISPRQIAKILSEYSIHSKNVRLPTGNTPKGYEKAQFQEAFMCYLPSATPCSAAIPPQSAEILGFDAILETPQEDRCGGSESDENTRKTAICGVVADKNAPLWEVEL